MNPGVVLHVAAGGIAILAGFGALSLRKGGDRHRLVGKVFVAAMLLMASSGAAMALAHGQKLNVLAGVFTAYLVATAWGALRRKPNSVGRFEWAAAGVALTVALAGFTLSARAVSGQAAAAYSIFAALALLAGLFDISVIRRGGVGGVDRIARHVWRVCLALFIAAASFFLGQADEIPAALSGPHLSIPPIAALASLLFWVIRIRLPRRGRPPLAVS